MDRPVLVTQQQFSSQSVGQSVGQSPGTNIWLWIGGFIIAILVVLFILALFDRTPAPAGPNPNLNPVIPAIATTYNANLNGFNEVPPNGSTATGTGKFTLAGTDNNWQLTYSVTFVGLVAPATVAHIHLGPSGVAGPIVKNLVPTFSGQLRSGGTYTGVWRTSDAQQPLTNALVVQLQNGNLYTNVHSTTYPDGEIRGQILQGS